MLILDDKVAIVTAAGRGIGRSIAGTLAKNGAHVVVNSHHEATTESTVDLVKSFGVRSFCVPGDISDSGVINAVHDKALKEFNRIDILVNNIGGGVSINNDIEYQWDFLFKKNLRAPVLMCERVARVMMVAGSGKIVNISSVAGRFVPSADHLSYPFVSVGYCVMKAALIQYTRLIAEMFGRYNINVNSVCPGIVLTDAWQSNAAQAVESIDEFKGMSPEDWFAGIFAGDYPKIFQNTPLGREQTVEDISEAVLYLVSDASKNITGQTLNVDGGMVKS